MSGIHQKCILLILTLLLILLFYVDSRGQLFDVFSVDVYSGLTFQQQDEQEIINLYFDFKGSFEARKPNWIRGVRVMGDISTISSNLDFGISAGYMSYDRVFTQQLQTNNFAVTHSKTDVLIRHHIVTGGIGFGHRFRGLGNSTLGIHTNAEMLLPFLDVTRVDSEVRRFLDDSPQHYHYTKSVNNFENKFQEYLIWPGFNLGLEVSYTYFMGKWGLKPFISGEYMSLNNRKLFASRLGLGFAFR